MNIVERIDSEIESRSLLKHPFYQMWSEGKLTVDHLKGYSMEYFQLVKAVPGMVENIAEKLPANADVASNAKEESDHVTPWVKFASALGISADDLKRYVGQTKTLASVQSLKELSSKSVAEAAAAMYAYEAELPRISRSKIDGLKKYYGLDGKAATEYFELHEEADVRHAQVWREILAAIPAEMQDAAFAAAVKSLEAQNMLLDSVQERYVGSSC